MFDFKTTKEKIYFVDGDENSGWFIAKKFSYDQIIELTEAKAGNTAVFLKTRVLEIGGFTIDGEAPNLESLVSWESGIIDLMWTRYFEVFGNKVDTDEKVKAKKK